jgi:flavin-binding protein dodecin
MRMSHGPSCLAHCHAVDGGIAIGTAAILNPVLPHEEAEALDQMPYRIRIWAMFRRATADQGSSMIILEPCLLWKGKVIMSAHPCVHAQTTGGSIMPDSVYKVIELVGTSTESWEKAAAQAVEKAGEHLRDLRIAEIVDLDMHLNEGKIEAYRAKVKISFKYEGGE